jgi:phosphoribosylaminoimidazole (AIR) synthetase
LNEILLTPTKIYVHDMLTLFQSKKILAAAHITGSGLMGNTVRVIPEGSFPASPSTGLSLPYLISSVKGERYRKRR